MKKKVSTLMTVGAALAVGLLLCEATLALTVEMKPTKIRLSDEGPEGPWLKCYIDVTGELTLIEAQAVKKKDVLLEGVLNPVIVNDCLSSGDRVLLLAHFDMAEVKALLAKSGQLGEVELTVTITLDDGTVLSGSDTVNVRK
jgi:hypothetical protein